MKDLDEIRYNTDCVFCPDHNYYLYQYLFGADTTIEDLIILRSENFIVIPDIAPLVEGYLLIIPTTHYSCFAKMPRDVFDEFESVKNIVGQLLTKLYTTPIFFEHGAAKPKQGGCCVDHAHFHCIPAAAKIPTLISDTLTSKPLTVLTDLLEYGNNDISYLYYEDGAGQKLCYPLNGDSCYLPSQYLRMLFAAGVKLDIWDWREMIISGESRVMCREYILNTLKKLRSGKESQPLTKHSNVHREEEQQL